MYIPSTPAFDLFMPESKNKIKLYVKRVFISDQVDELLPQYLRFVHGIIDSEDLPLNVSRETLQFNPMIDRINKRVVNQILKELTKIAEKDKEKYNIFWKHFGSVLKEGIYTDSDQRDKILKISKFASINNEEFITLDEYILNMPKNQKYIYYLSGQNVEELKNSPHLEALKSQKMNVLLITDPVDEVWMPIVNQFEEKPFKSITHGDLELKENKKTSDENSQKELDGLLQWLKEKLSDEERELVLKAARLSRAYMVGVDHIIYKNKPYLLEINGSPGSGADYEGYQHKDYYSDSEPSGRIDGEEMMANVVDWIENRTHWDRQSLIECGWLETVELDEVGKVRVKFDTGNGSEACALHADKIIDSKGKNVKWKYNGKVYTKPKKGVSKVFRSNATNEPSETRPTVSMALTFNGFTYPDIEVGLDSRPRSGSDLLVNRDLMRQMNVAVNPNRTFVLSKRLRPIEKEGKQDKVGFEKK